jgi:hypothetical protein
MADFNPEDLAAKIDHEGGLQGGALMYFGRKGPDDVPQRVKEAWADAYDATEALCDILEGEGALL